jgi:hypothetical protein
MAKQQSPVNKKNVDEANKALGEQINLIAAVADMMKDVVSQVKNKGELDKGSLDLTRQTLKLTRDIASEYQSMDAVQKDITKQYQQQNKNASQIEAISSNLSDHEKEALKNFEKKNDKLNKAKALEQQMLKAKSEGKKFDANALKSVQASVKSHEEAVSLAGAQLSNQAEQVVFLQQANKEINGNLALLAEQERRQQNLLDAQKGIVNFTGQFGKVLTKLGATGAGKVLTDTFEKSKKAIYDATDGGKNMIGGLQKAKIAAKSFGSVLKVALGPMALIGMAVSLFNKFKKDAEEGARYLATISHEQKNFTKDLGVSVTVGKQLYGQVEGIGKGMGMTREEAVGAGKEIYSALGGVESMTDSTAKAFIKLNAHGGIAADTLKQMHTMAKLTGEDAGEVANQIATTAQESIKSLKLNVSMKNIMKSVAGVSNNVKLAMGGSAKAITQAVAKAKKLGLEMKDVENISSSLLNIEDSLAAEMEAELLTGKELNLEKARAAALAGDQSKVMDELAKQGITQAEYAGMNVLQQEAIAKAMGMSRDDMAKMLVTQKENTAENMDQVDFQKEGLNAMTATASALDAINRREEERLKSLAEGGEQMLAFNEAMDRLKIALQPILDNLFIPILGVITDMVDGIGKFIAGITSTKKGMDGMKDGLSFMLKIILGIKAAQFAINTYNKIAQGIQKGKLFLQKMTNKEKIKEGTVETANQVKQSAGFIKSVGIAIMKAISSLASIPVAGWALGLAAAGIIGGIAAKYMNDGMQGPVGGKAGYSRTMFGPEGAISFNDKDTIVAGTNLGGGGGNNNNAELGRIADLLEKLLNKEGGVYIDGNKVGATIALTNYEQQ